MWKNTKNSVCEHVHVHGFLSRDHVHNIYIHLKLLNSVYTSGITTPKQGCVLTINVTFMYCHLHVLPPSCTATFMYCHLHVLSPSCTATLMYCHLHVLPPSCTATFMYCHLHVLPPSCTATLMYCHRHVLPPSCTATFMYCHPHVLPPHIWSTHSLLYFVYQLCNHAIF